MMIFIYGDDNFRVSEKARQLIEGFKKKYDPSGLNLTQFPTESSKFEFGEIMSAVRSFPFLSAKRMVVIRGLLEYVKKGDADIWAQSFKSVPDSSVVIFWETVEPKVLEKKPLFEMLKSVSDVCHYPFPCLLGSDLNKWIIQRVRIRGGAVDQKAVVELVLRVGQDLWQMDHEISKLVAYANGTNITVEMVLNLVRANHEGKIFELVDAISQHRRKEAVRLLNEERLAGSDDHYLLTMLGRQVRILLGARALLDENPRATKQDLASALALHPFVAQKALAQARSFTIEGLKAVHDLLFEFDEQIKTGQMNVDMAVDLTAVKLIG